MSRIFLKKDLDLIVEEIKKGKKILAFPTDTVFGLGCLFNDFDSLNRIKELKNRDKHKPIPVMCSDVSMIEKICDLNNDDYKLLNKFKKGPLTYIFKKKNEIDYTISNGFDTLAIRIPDDDFILNLLNKLKQPLLVTSCNISNEPSIMKFSEIIEKFNGKIDLIVAEDAKSEVSSTIYDTINKKIIREGIITKEMIEEVLND